MKHLPEDVRLVLTEAATLTGINPKAILTRSRLMEIAIPRHLAAYILRRKGYSTTETGKYLNRNHASMIHSTKVIRNMLTFKNPYQEKIKDIMTKLEITDDEVMTIERKPDYIKVGFKEIEIENRYSQDIRSQFEKIENIKVITAEKTEYESGKVVYHWLMAEIKPGTTKQQIEAIIEEIYKEPMVAVCHFLYHN